MSSDSIRSVFPVLAAFADKQSQHTLEEVAFWDEQRALLNANLTRDDAVKQANARLGKHDEKAKTKAEAIEDLVGYLWKVSPVYIAQYEAQKAAETETHTMLFVMNQFRESAEQMRREVKGLAEVAATALESLNTKGHLPTSHYAQRGADVEIATAKTQANAYSVSVVSQGNRSIYAWVNEMVQKDENRGYRSYASLGLLIDMLRAEDKADQERADALNALPSRLSLNEALATLGETLDSLA